MTPPVLHCPAMIDEVIALFKSAPFPQCFLDATFGRGGHTLALLNHFENCKVVALDRDPEAISYATDHMNQFIQTGRLQVIKTRFSDMGKLFSGSPFSGILFDLGLSSPQLDQASRGFSFSQEGPLDMRMGLEGNTAGDVLSSFKEEELANLFFQYGQEPYSRRIAKAIVQARKASPLKSTLQLSQIIQKKVPYHRKKHPATRIFQALRIYVNEELEEIHKVLPMACALLKPAGCLVVISFHSLEDRIVKIFFKSCPTFTFIAKKPLRPSVQEIQRNPRIRSACLRFGVR